MKRIGMLLDNPYTGDNRVINEARFLQLQGFDVYVLALNFGDHAPIEDLDGVRVRRVPIPEKYKNYLFALYHRLPLFNQFWKKHGRIFIEEFNIEALHVHDLYMGEAGAALARQFNIPLVIDLHENYPAAVLNYQWTQNFPGNLVAGAQLWKKKEEAILLQADRIIVLSEYYRDQLCREYPDLHPETFVVYPNVPDHEALLAYPVGENPLPHPESHWLFYFGVIAKRRGVYTAIDAVKKLREQGHDVRLLLAGNVNKAEQATFDSRINDPEVRDFVLHKPWIDISEFPTYAKACTAGLSPIFKGEQHDIGVANKVFQYMLFGLPVIASNSAAQAAVVQENECGVVFESESVEGFVEVAEKILSHDFICDKMGLNGHEAVKGKFNLQVAGEELVSLYKALG